MSDSELREIIFDTETTGLKPEEGERVIEIGAIELFNRFPTGKTFHYYINPEGRQVHPDALRVHGITDDFLKDKPSFADILEEFAEFFREGILVAHNASFDMGFINAELSRQDLPPIGNDRVIDTLALARRKHPTERNSLDALCSRYRIDNSHREKHGALLDAELLAEVYIELLGGKQASLVLDAPAAETENRRASEASGLAKPLPKRPGTLPPRLDEEALSRHRAFVKTLGEDAIWKQYLD